MGGPVRRPGQGSKWIRRDKRLAIYLRDGMACAYCGAVFEDGVGLSLDHLICSSKGGSNKASNLVTSCISCNSRRRDMPLEDWLISQFGEDAASVARFITEHIAKDLKPYRVEAKAILARRRKA